MDVSSGVESSRGVKDVARIRAFVEAVRSIPLSRTRADDGREAPPPAGGEPPVRPVVRRQAVRSVGTNSRRNASVSSQPSTAWQGTPSALTG
ncbi:hypothetical protein [Curtobacterium sp. MCJR17_043]|uniref:phosphoribosylanthranilate isomerase n=1 Tax=Curtobacterium sp. MCJR17_043 TaxID=2175660 RepID=UPI0032E926A5